MCFIRLSLDSCAKCYQLTSSFSPCLESLLISVFYSFLVHVYFLWNLVVPKSIVIPII